MIIWTALITSVFIYPPFLDSGYPLTFTNDPLRFTWVLLLSLALLLVSTLIRWAVLPRVIHLGLTIPLLIVGLALTESTVFFEIFLFEDSFANEKALIFWLAVLTMASYCPLFIKRRSEPPSVKNFQ